VEKRGGELGDHLMRKSERELEEEKSLLEKKKEVGVGAGRICIFPTTRPAVNRFEN
jgi:hypothetical protein